MKVLDYRNYLIRTFKKSEEHANLYLLNEKFTTGIPEVGDTVEVIDKSNNDRKPKKDAVPPEGGVVVPLGKVLPDDVHEYLLSQPTFKILGVKQNAKGGWVIDIGCISKNTGEVYLYLFKRFKLIEPPIEKREGFVNIVLSDSVINHLKKLKFDPIANFILELRYGVPEDKIRQGFVNYFDMDKKEKSFVSYLKNDEVGKIIPEEEIWTSNRRKSSTFLKALRRIFSDEFMKVLDIDWTKKEAGRAKVSIAENFAANWRYLFDNGMKFEILRGPDTLRAYNYKGEIDINSFDYSCANYDENGHGIDPKRFDIFAKNEENCGIVVIFKQGKIEGRAAMFEGEAQYTDGKYQKGTHYAMMVNPYTNKDRKYKTAYIDWAIENNVETTDKMHYNLVLPLKTRVCDQYPPMDECYVNIKLDLICNNIPNIKGLKDGDFHETYGLNVKNIATRNHLEMEY